MKTALILVGTFVLVLFVALASIASEISWSDKAEDSSSLRQLVGLPSVAIGNLNPSARNPGLEVFCTSLYDTPGGYCAYFAPGVPFITFKMADNITVSGNR
jgi:hypothetical protein